ncbi:MAG TPA: SPOR domain-containing protein [Verrucomicrobiae bacterium]|nr:SPOR domain-containing protein [Verrucomicrobiae bacterium]
MTWPSNGEYYIFKEEVIARRAPAVSGVFGIYNVRHYLLIGHSNNIREALLRHRRETRFRFRRLEPTGFTFEECSPELREFRARRLAWEHDPIIRGGGAAGLAALWRSWTAPRARPAQGGADSENVRRDRYALAGAAFALIIAANALLVLLGENKNYTESWTRKLLSLAHQFTPLAGQSSGAASETPARQAAVFGAGKPAQPASAEAAGEFSPEKQAVDGGRKLEPAAVARAQSSSPLPSATSIEPESAAPANLQDSAKTRVRRPDSGPRLWTVRAISTPDKDDALNWLARLKAKGYDAAIVVADIKGRQWYRVRVGNLANRQEAERLAKTLQSKEGFADAFVAYSTRADAVLTSNRR